MPGWTSNLRGVILFTITYLVIAAVAGVMSGNREFLMYIVIMLVTIAGVLVIHTRVRFSTALLWCLSLWGLLHMAGGLVPVPESWPIHGDQRVLYSLWLWPGGLKYDQITHAYGFGIATWACWQCLRVMVAARGKGPVRPTFGMLLLCVLGGMGLGALNEVVEFAATLLVEETNVGGYVNTGWDLVANLAGTLVAAVVIGVFGR